MGLSSIYNRIALISPYCEIALRHLYWKNVKWLGKFNPNKPTKPSAPGETKHVDFEKVIDWLKAKGVGEGSLLIVHSSYGGLECTGLSPDEIIDRLLELVGKTGTLCMPVIRSFKEEKKAHKEGTSLDNVVIKYNVMKTMVSSGILPYTLMHRDGAVVSHFPYNPLCAIGPLAKPMMEHNLDGDCPSPHGPNSSWKFCYDHNALVCSIGTDIEHHNTISHIAEEAFGNWRWSDEEWFDIRTFEIIDENKNSRIVKVKNRKGGWGTLHLAEIYSCRNSLQNGFMQSDLIDGKVRVGFVYPDRFIEYKLGKASSGYPYYLFPWQKPNKVK